VVGNRPGAGRDPEFPPPSIIDYKPKSTLVVAEHPVPRAKVPVIDIHSHQPAPISPQQLETVVKSMDPLNLRILVNATGASQRAPSCETMSCGTKLPSPKVQSISSRRGKRAPSSL
jgi:hypothetical protein